MAINFKKYFLEAQKLDINPIQISYSTRTETTIEIYNDEIVSQVIGTNRSLNANGVVDSKRGKYRTDSIDKNTPIIVAKEIFESAKYGRIVSKNNYFAGGKKYKKAKTNYKDFKKTNLLEMQKVAFDISKYARLLDKRVTKVELSITMDESFHQKTNNLGLNCKERSRFFEGYIYLVCQNYDSEVRDSEKSFFNFHSLEELKNNIYNMLPSIIQNATDFFKSGPVKSKNYKILLNQNCVATFIEYYLAQLNAKLVHNHLSLFENKLNTQVVSKCLTIKHTPHIEAVSATSYDSDGHPTQDFTIIDKGILKDYFYSIETANEDKRETNGCASGNGNGDFIVVSIKPGRLKKQQLLKKLNNGLYITSLDGLNSGIDDQTLNFSLPASGYLVENGKIVKSISLIVVSGNLNDLFNNVLFVGNDVETKSSVAAPSLIIKNLAIAGK